MNKILFNHYACGIKWIDACYPTFKSKIISRHSFNQFLMRLNLIIFFIAISFLKTTASSGQNISLSVKNAPLEKVLKDIEKQSGFIFWYEKEQLQNAKPVDLKLNKASLPEALEACFKNQPFTYIINDKLVTIKVKEKNIAERVIDFFQEIEVRGRIMDEKGEPLAGAYVTIKGTNRRTTTKADGSFFLPNVDEKALLLISYLGYDPKEVKAEKDMGTITLVMIASNLNLVSVVSTGYQAIPKERATGSFVLIDSALINRKVGSNILDRLDGVTSGLIFTNNGSRQYHQSDIQIRGRATLFANAEPLIVVDNFPYDGDLGNINPNDIENITILKDAAAASAWGARSGNGVIVITTKKGKLNTTPKISFNANINIGDKPNLYYTPQLSSSQFIEVEQFLYNQGAFWTIGDGFSDLSPAIEIFRKTDEGMISSSDSLAMINKLKTYDAREQLLKYYYRQSINQQYQTGISGGGNNQKYFISAGYDRNLNNVINSSYDRITLTASNTYYFLKNRLELFTNIVYAGSKSKSGSGISLRYPYDQLADGNGNPLAVAKTLRFSYIETANDKLLDWVYKPLDELNKGYSTTTTNLTDYRINLSLNYNIFPSLKASLLYGYQRGITEGNQLNEVDSYFTRSLINTFAQINTSTGDVSFPIPYGDILYSNTQNIRSHNGRFQLNYNNAWGKHALNGVGGIEIKDFNGFTSTSGLYGYDPETASNQNAAINYTYTYPYSFGWNSGRIPTNTAQQGTTDRYVSYYSNLSYIYSEKYIVSLSARRDESNLFGVKTNQKGVPLWSAGLSWIPSKEEFYQATWLPQLKLRATYGYTGNVDKTLSAYLTSSVEQNYYQPYNAPLAVIVNPPNPSLRWEKVQNVDLGLDFSLNKSRLSGSIDYWRKKGSDLIGNSLIAPQTGIALFKGNSATTLSQGLDIQLNSVNLNGKFKWNTTLLHNYSKDKVLEYKVSNGSNYNVVSTNYNNPLEDYPYYSIFSFKYKGLDATGNPIGYLNGDQSNDYPSIINSTNRDDLVYSGSATPTSFGSIRNTFDYKGFDLSFNIVYKLGYYFRRQSLSNSGLYSYSPSYLQADYSLRWQQPGDELTTNVPALIYPADFNSDLLYAYSDVLVEKGDHIRLQDIRLGYTSEGKKLRPFSSITLFTYVSNIGILWRSNKQNIDPDFPSGIPAVRTIAFGLKASL